MKAMVRTHIQIDDDILNNKIITRKFGMLKIKTNGDGNMLMS